jgi:hypothetical protein
MLAKTPSAITAMRRRAGWAMAGVHRAMDAVPVDIPVMSATAWAIIMADVIGAVRTRFSLRANDSANDRQPKHY